MLSHRKVKPHQLYQFRWPLNPNRAGLLDVAWERGGGWISPHLLDHLKTLWKTKKIFFDFPKVHYELGKVMKFGTSRTLFSWRNGSLKIVQADSAPPIPNRVNESRFWWWWIFCFKINSTWYELSKVATCWAYCVILLAKYVYAITLKFEVYFELSINCFHQKDLPKPHYWGIFP